MIDAYSWITPNGHKLHIMLEEAGLGYRLHAVNIGKGEQFEPEFLQISPNQRIPAITDQDGPGGKPVSLFESGAILMYLGDKTGQFYPTDARKRAAVNEWIMFQMAGVGPMFGQASHFISYTQEKSGNEYALERYTRESKRLTGVLNRRLGEHEYLADDYSIADMLTYPWIAAARKFAFDMDEWPHVIRWLNKIGERPAVQRGMQMLSEHSNGGPISDEARENLFGDKQYEER